ncbi:hypothetical protein BN873_200015 [Candidatus Competibacter denitrificans Run_A_D11]|uniref:Uncharacterized protein n=1 Tax=Candidatus Competibacter denitrificans Run_A_D11 TaxID=1400863 RepID=W6M2N5_9GAMM|nr:hypothetical protein BN873_200015 [Candidatus Competibacter denitrificans Run_A_D11]
MRRRMRMRRKRGDGYRLPFDKLWLKRRIKAATNKFSLTSSVSFYDTSRLAELIQEKP